MVGWAVARAGPLGAGLVGLLAFLALYGPAALDPTRLGWLIRDDFSQHLLGWLFFRNTPMGFPLGALPGYVHPLGTTLGYMDAMPWVALVLRPLSGLLPVDFQYIGPWLCLCLVLQGAVGAWVARRLGGTVAHQWGVGALLVLSPALLARMSMAHEALSAHWMIVLLVGLHLVPQRDARDARRTLGTVLGLCVLAAGLHPVLAVMVLALGVALCARTLLEGRVGWKGPVLTAAASLGVVPGLFLAFGYFGAGAPLQGASFGDYSADLAAFFNPLGFRDVRWSRFLPGQPRGWGQYEGFAYLGLGVLFALFAAAVLAVWRARDVARLWRRWLPVGLVALGLAFFALSWRVTWMGEPVANLSAFYRPGLKWAEAFRSSGRFVWPLYYLLVLGAALTLLRLPRVQAASSLLGLVLVLQVLDLNLGEGRQSQHEVRWNSPPSPAMEAAAKGRKHLVLYPPQSYDSSGRGCRAGPQNFHHWAYRAYRLGLTFNSGYVARLDDARAQKYCLGLDDEIRAGRLDPDIVYLSIPERLHEFQRIPGTRCSLEEGLWMCVLEAQR
nr:putative membrane protein [uncultured bacterium]